MTAALGAPPSVDGCCPDGGRDLLTSVWAIRTCVSSISFANCSASGHLASPTEFWQDAFDVTQPALYEFLDRLLGEMASRFPDSIVSRTIIAAVWLAFSQECQQ